MTRHHQISYRCDNPTLWLYLPAGVACTCNKKDTK